MGALVVSPRQTVPLFLTVSRAGVGGVAGLTPTVRVYRSSDGYYLDWNDNTFKNAGWTQQSGSLTDLGGGHYNRPLNLALAGVVPKTVLIALYSIPAPLAAAANDVLHVEDLELMRQAVCNRMEEAPGDPGLLTLYDDDGLTPRASWQIRDALGNGILSTTGTPARRSAKL